MRKLLKFNTLLVVGITSILLVGFQNCSKYQYEAVDVADGSNSGLNTDTLPDNSSNEVNQIPPVVSGGGASTPVGDGGKGGMGTDDSGTGATSPPVIGGGGTSSGGGSSPVSGDGSMPPVIGGGGGTTSPVIKPPSSEEEECIEYAMGKKDDDDDHDQDNKNNVSSNDGKNSLGSRASCDKGEKEEEIAKSVGNKCYINVDEDDDEEDLKNYCNKKYSGNSSSKNRGVIANTITNRRGKLIITADNIQHINLIDDFRGKLILCGVSVDKISNTRGKIVLVDSKVGELINHKGALKIIGTSGSSNVTYSNTKIQIDRTR